MKCTYGTLEEGGCKPDKTSCDFVEFCGDGVLNSGEHCDNTLLGAANSCDDLGFKYNDPLTCAVNCFLDTSACEPKSPCGNSIIDPGEDCDVNNFGPVLNVSGLNCTSYDPFPSNPYFSGGKVKCTACQLDTSGCTGTPSGTSTCGDNFLNIGEECDGVNFGVIDNCAELGFENGTLSCNNCGLDTSSCSPIPDCGNDIIDPKEECDGLNLGNLTTSCADYTPIFNF